MSTERIQKLEDAVEELKQSSSAKPRDAWDKVGIVGQILSSVVLAAVGIGFSYFSNRADIREKEIESSRAENASIAQQRLSTQQSSAQSALSAQQSKAQLDLETIHDRAELDLENRKNVSEFVSKLTDKIDNTKRAELLGHMETSLRPEEIVRIAMSYTDPAYAMHRWVDITGLPATFNDENVVPTRALKVLQHIKEDGAGELERISDGNTIPDKEIAAALLGKKTHVYVRGSEVDDFAEIYVNDRMVLSHRLGFQENSGWVDVSRWIKVGSNFVRLVIINGESGGFGGRLEISAGTDQYDTGPLVRNSCPCNKPAFIVDVNVTKTSDGRLKILQDYPRVLPD